jgi:hypothetical protein
MCERFSYPLTICQPLKKVAFICVQVKEFAEEEGDKSPFKILNNDITRVLTTILVATTICSIYSAALFTNLAIQVSSTVWIRNAWHTVTVLQLHCVVHRIAYSVSVLTVGNTIELQHCKL